jgi:hypothetical protein
MKAANARPMVKELLFSFLRDFWSFGDLVLVSERYLEVEFLGLGQVGS